MRDQKKLTPMEPLHNDELCACFVNYFSDLNDKFLIKNI
jgi:hypothetical protein